MNLAALCAMGIPPTQARMFFASLLYASARFDIMGAIREAAFVSQCAHESRMFTTLEEGLFYRTPERIRMMFHGSVPTLDIAQRLVGKPQALANHVYANRLGNGDEASGDGWKYRGRGLIQLTGKNNYSDAATELARPYVDQPDLLLQPGDACLSAAWFWHVRKLNVLADASAIDAITRAVNGPAMAGAVERRQLFDQGVQAFSPVVTINQGTPA